MGKRDLEVPKVCWGGCWWPPEPWAGSERSGGACWLEEMGPFWSGV